MKKKDRICPKCGFDRFVGDTADGKVWLICPVCGTQEEIKQQ